MHNFKNHSTLPQGFVHNLQIPNYLKGEFETNTGVSVIENRGVWGRRWRFWFMHFEHYAGDQEPHIEKRSYYRFIFWQRTTRQDVPRGWRRNIFFPELIRKIGFVRVEGSYAKTWDYSARRDLKKWESQHRFKIVPSDYETFFQEYPQRGKYGSIRALILGIVRRKHEHFGENIHFFAARNVDTGEVGGMVALLDMATYQKAYYLAAFTKDEGKEFRVGTGLMEYCFKYCIEHQIPFFDFGCFWVPGNPKSWKGFSDFKQKFGATLVQYPRGLWRFVPRGRD